MTVRPFTVVLVLALATTLLSACNGSSSGGTYNQAFNVSGQWSGSVKDTVYGEGLITMTLADSGGGVTGQMINFGPISCFTGYSIAQLTGVASQLPVKTFDDNPLTSDQENSNQGSVVLSMTVEETFVVVGADGSLEEKTTEYIVTFALTGNSSTLIGNWGGTWIGPLPVSANFCRYPGIQGSLTLQRI